ncbi:MAG: DUF1684 domain-containing protein [bacterium]|jgi:uncharacterized protein
MISFLKTNMMLTKFLMAFFVIYFLTACNYNSISEEDYFDQINHDRMLKNEEITDSATSRFNEEERKAFSQRGLQYFPPDLSYRVIADFTLDTSNPVFQMPTTTDRKPNYRIYGYLDFEIKDTACRLVVFQNYDARNHPEHGNYVFIPFKDNTNEFGTYGGGRYIDLEMPQSETVLLDFNLAYNPYCAYSSRWSCPLVPAVNTLEVAIFAGEKEYK